MRSNFSHHKKKILIFTTICVLSYITVKNKEEINVRQSSDLLGNFHINIMVRENYTGDKLNEKYDDIEMKIMHDYRVVSDEENDRQKGLSSDEYKLNADKYFAVDRTVQTVSCSKLFAKDNTEIEKAKAVSKTKVKHHMEYLQNNESCENFIKKRGYIMSPLTEEEANFSIAYSVLMYKAPEQTERLLRAIYRPQNIYCIHIDNKTSSDIYEKMEYVASCFDNVFITEKRIDVKWGEMSVLIPEIICMRELWKRSTKWKYFINLTGQEFPLRTNHELVKILTALNGANDVEGTRQRDQGRWKRAGPVPFNALPTKGALHITGSRGFIDYILHDERAHAIYQWSRKVKIPDEIFFSTLNHNPLLQAPGSYSGDDPETTSFSDTTKPYISRFKNRGKYLYKWPCAGMRIRGVCILSPGDLWLLAKRKELFANKFHINYHPITLDCMEELIYNRTRDEYFGKLHFVSKWYNKLGFVKNHVP